MFLNVTKKAHIGRCRPGNTEDASANIQILVKVRESAELFLK